MDQDHLRDTSTRAKGSMMEAIGKVTGNAATQAEGAAQMSAGQVRKAVGPAFDKAHAALSGNA